MPGEDRAWQPRTMAGTGHASADLKPHANASCLISACLGQSFGVNRGCRLDLRVPLRDPPIPVLALESRALYQSPFSFLPPWLYSMLINHNALKVHCFLVLSLVVVLSRVEPVHFFLLSGRVFVVFFFLWLSLLH